MTKLKQYELTDKQIQACKEIEKAFKTARKAGLSFYGKGGAISAYKTSAMKHAAPSVQYEGSGHFGKDWESPIPSYDLYNCIIDSGADDAEYFEKGFID